MTVKLIPVHQMLDDLRFIKLSEQMRAEVNAAKYLLEKDGSLPWKMVNSIRKMYKRHSRKINEMKESRERGRISLAKAAMELSEDEIKKRRDDRIAALRDKLSDLGF